MEWIVEGLIIAAMLALNAVFAAYEMALASVTRPRLQALAQAHRRGAPAALRMKGRLERSLAVVQVGITLAGAIAAATGGAGVDEFVAPWLTRRFGLTDAMADFLAVTLLVLPLSAVTIVFAELVPKMFAIKNNEPVVLWLSPAMEAIAYVLHPAILLLETTVKRIMRLGERRREGLQLTADRKEGLLELRAAVSLARASRVIGPLEERIVDSAVQLSVRSLRDVMLPAAEIVMIPQDATLGDAFLEAHLHMHTRYPTCTQKGNPQTITGYVNFKDIVAALKISPADPRLRNILRPIPRMDAGTSLALALEQMTRDAVHIALVTGTGGDIVGLVTLENLVEELVGSIDDEYDRLPVHLHGLTTGWIVGGGATMGAIRSAVGVAPSGETLDRMTLAEWCADRNPAPLSTDTVIRADGLEVRIRKMRRRKVMEAVLARTERAPDLPSPPP